MKRLLVAVLLCSVLVVGLTGCMKDESVKRDVALDDVYNKVGEYFGDEQADRSNLGAYYLDTEKNVVVVELVDNSKEEQARFNKMAKVDANYITFVQGGPYNSSAEK